MRQSETIGDDRRQSETIGDDRIRTPGGPLPARDSRGSRCQLDVASGPRGDGSRAAPEHEISSNATREENDQSPAGGGIRGARPHAFHVVIFQHIATYLS